MSYKVIVDSCGELTEEMKRSGYYETASLSIDVDDHHIVDDETFDQKRFLALWRRAPTRRSRAARPRRDIWRATAAMRSGCTR